MDITQARKQITQLRRERDYYKQLAFIDPLTGCLTRTALQHRYSHNPHNVVAIADLDGLKEINDTQGHHAGDRLIARTGETLKRLAGKGVARLGGDEFLLVDPLPDVEWATGKSGINISVGYGQAGTLHEAMAEADAGMYARKQKSKRKST